MKSEKIDVTVQPASENAGEAFEMEAPRYQSGGNHDTQDRGYGSGIGVAQRGENAVENMKNESSQEELPDFNPHATFSPNITTPAPNEPGGQDFQKLYGQSENEKGQWRKTAQEALSELEQMKRELAAMRMSTPYAQPGYPQPQQPPQQQPAQATVDQLPQTFFPDKGEGDLVEVKDVDAMVRSVVAPAVLQIYNQQQELHRQYVEGQKAAAGITPDVERQLLSECPWMQQIPDGQARIQAMQSYARQKLASQQQAAQPSQPRQATVTPEQAAARRVTYIESGQAAKSSESEIPLAQRVAQEFGAAKTAAEKKAVLVKYGMQQVNDWGADVWGPAR